MELVSIIMPCYNDGEYLQESITSLKEQTYPNIELIIIDDGSTEKETIDAYNLVELIPNHQLLHSDHLGPAQARNYGIENANGKYILPLDADDKIAPSYIEKAVKILESNPNIGVVYCYAELFGEKSGRWELPDYSFDAMLLDNIVFVSAVFYKSDWKKIGGYSSQYKHGMEDYSFWLSMLELEREIYQIHEVLFYYRIKPASRTTRFMDSYEYVQETYKLLYNDHRVLYDRYRDDYAIALRRALIHQLFDCRQLQEEIKKTKEVYPMVDKIIKKIPRPIKKFVRKLIIWR